MRILLVLALLCSSLAPACRSASARDSKAASVAPAERPVVTIVTRAGGRHGVRVELARTDDERSRGLMHRRSLGDSEGMLFFFEKDDDHSFWMKNTLIPLDMIFIDVHGTIVGIVREAQPLTETPRKVGARSRFVLEVPGGWAAMRGIDRGDRVDLGAVVDGREGTADTR